VPPTDASTDTGTASAPSSAFAGPAVDPAADPVSGSGTAPGPGPNPGSDCEETLDLRLPGGFLALRNQEEPEAPPDPRPDDDLLDHVADWGAMTTPVGVFHLVPVHLGRDLPLIAGWMNDPAVTAFWDLGGDASVTERHLRTQLAGDGRSVPCLGVLDRTPMSYWEIYRADLDPLARHCPARPHDTGIHILIGGVADRGRGLGSALLRSVADLILDRRPSCARVIAEPDLRNTPSIAAFLSAGFWYSAEVDLPDKRAALMVRDRVLRHVL